MQSTFRLSAFNLYFDPCRGSLIALGRALEREREDIIGTLRSRTGARTTADRKLFSHKKHAH